MEAAPPLGHCTARVGANGVSAHLSGGNGHQHTPTRGQVLCPSAHLSVGYGQERTPTRGQVAYPGAHLLGGNWLGEQRHRLPGQAEHALLPACVVSLSRGALPKAYSPSGGGRQLSACDAMPTSVQASTCQGMRIPEQARRSLRCSELPIDQAGTQITALQQAAK